MQIFNKPMAREIPCEDVELTGLNFEMKNIFTEEPEDMINAGVYLPLGVEAEPGMTIPGEFWCHGAVYRANPDGSNPERVAWGLRSVYGLGFSPDGRLVVTQNSGNIMQPRPIYDDWETIYEIEEGGWYGWPDFYSGLPIVDERFTRPDDPEFSGEPFPHDFSLSEETRNRLTGGSGEPIQPLVRLPVHSAAEGMVFGNPDWGMDGENEVLVAEFGAIIPYYKDQDEWPGFRVQKVNLKTGEITDFLVNKSKKPAWADNSDGLRRPLQVTWGPDGALYVADFGVIRFDEEGMTAEPGTGVIWKVQPTDIATGTTTNAPPVAPFTVAGGEGAPPLETLSPAPAVGVRGADGVLVSAAAFSQMELTGSTGDDVGTMDDLLIDPITGRILYAALAEGMIDFDEGAERLLPLSAFAWDDDSDNLPLAIPTELFDGIPGVGAFDAGLNAEGELLPYWSGAGLAPFPEWLAPETVLPLSALVDWGWDDETLGAVTVADLLLDIAAAEVKYVLLDVAGDDSIIPVPWAAVDVAVTLDEEQVFNSADAVELALVINAPLDVLDDAPRLAGDVLGHTFAPTADNAIAWYWQRAGYPLGISGAQ
jgi:sporulation protein YlmC with PRC-barrel domain